MDSKVLKSLTGKNFNILLIGRIPLIKEQIQKSSVKPHPPWVTVYYQF